MKKSILKSTIVVLACSVAAKILSYIWEASLAAYLGASDEADCFYMMLGIFNILYPVLDLGIWKVFMPIYKTKLARNLTSDAEKIANISIAFFFSLSLLLIVTLIAFAGPLTILIAPGFSAEKKLITAKYIRIASPLYLTMAVSSVVGAVLQSHEKFFGSQLREIGAHVSKIACLWICYRYFGIYAAVIAYIIGSVCRVLVQLPFIDWKWNFRIDLRFRDADVMTMMKGLPSVAITSAVTNLNGLIDKRFASDALSGSVACLNYGHKLMNVFSGTISTAIGTATYPTMIQYIAEGEEEKLKSLIGNIIGVLAFIIVPISLFCMSFSKELVTIAFQRGAFDASATELTAAVFLCYCIGMLFTGVTTVVSNVFYGYGDTKTTMWISLANVLINILLNLILIRVMGVAGLALATSISTAVSLAIRLICLKKLIRLDYGTILKETLKILAISLAAVGMAWLIFKRLLSLSILMSLLGSVFVIALCGIGLAKLLHVKAFQFFRELLRSRFRRNRASHE